MSRSLLYIISRVTGIVLGSDAALSLRIRGGDAGWALRVRLVRQPIATCCASLWLGHRVKPPIATTRERLLKRAFNKARTYVSLTSDFRISFIYLLNMPR